MYHHHCHDVCSHYLVSLCHFCVTTVSLLCLQLPFPGPALGPAQPSSITSCSFDSLNYAVVVQNWADLTLSDNVVARSVRTAFDVDAQSKGLKLIHNMVRTCMGAMLSWRGGSLW